MYILDLGCTLPGLDAAILFYMARTEGDVQSASIVAWSRGQRGKP